MRAWLETLMDLRMGLDGRERAIVHLYFDAGTCRVVL